MSKAPARWCLLSAVVALLLLLISCTPELSDFAVQIAPSDPAPGVALEATVVGDVGDVTWSWLADGVSQDDLTTASVPADRTAAGERWTVLVAATSSTRAATDSVQVVSAAPPSVDGDSDGSFLPLDCDDGDPLVFPGAEELCNEVDDDCDGAVDELPDGDGDGAGACDDCDDADPTRGPTLPEVCEPGGVDDQVDNNCDVDDDEHGLALSYPDPDGDGVGAGDAAFLCDEVPAGNAFCGYGPDADCAPDCDEADPAVHPGAPELCNGIDDDCDGCGGDSEGDHIEDAECADSTGEVAGDIDRDGDGFADCAGDPNEGEAAIYPGAPELCDGLDNDADGVFLEDELDDDGDGYLGCWDDCDDNDASVHPTATELDCDGVDTNCDGWLAPDEADNDLDGVTECGPDGIVGTLDDDCDDGNPTISSAAAELCDGLDNDCDGVVPLDEADDDGDGHVECSLEPEPWPLGYVGFAGLSGGDCNDEPSDPVASNVFPDAPELADSFWTGFTWRLVDNQCPGDAGHDVDGNPDPGEYCDGPLATDPVDCVVPGAECFACVGSEFDQDDDQQSEATGDCDDDDPFVYSGAPELDDGLDNDCDGLFPPTETVSDADGDGFSDEDGDCDDNNPDVHPLAFDDRALLLFDDDCDGVMDEEGILAGDVVITEVMARPSPSVEHEWIEVFNTTDDTIDLLGWIIDDPFGQADALQDSIELVAGQFGVLCRSPWVAETYNIPCLNVTDLAPFNIAHDSDGVSLVVPGRASGDLVVDEFAWMSSLADSGASFVLGNDAFQDLGALGSTNDDPNNWCESWSSWAPGSDLGSPGAENPSCFTVDLDHDADGYCGNGVDLNLDGDCQDIFEEDPDGGDCDDGDSDTYPGAPEACNDGIDQDCDGSDLPCIELIEVGSAASNSTQTDVWRGNTYLVTQSGTLTSFSQSLDVPVAGCLLTFTVASASDLAGPWTIEAQEALSVGSSATGPAPRDSPTLDHPLEAGTYYAVGLGTDCTVGYLSGIRTPGGAVGELGTYAGQALCNSSSESLCGAISNSIAQHQLLTVHY